MKHTQTITAKALIKKAEKIISLIDDEGAEKVGDSLDLYKEHEASAETLIGWICFYEKILHVESMSLLTKSQSHELANRSILKVV